MTINRPEAIGYLKNFDFKGLFRESLGWSRADDSRTLAYNGQNFKFDAFAQQAGVTAYACQVADISKLDYQTRNQIERVAAPSFPSHLFVFFDGEAMVWQWSRREIGQPRQLRAVGPFRKTSSFEPIIQKLDVLKYDIENGNVQATDVDQRLKQAFNVEPVTKKFYKEFEQEYKDFLKAITGIAEGFEREFASLMLNRLMFLYFIQSKGFFPKVEVAGLKPTDYLFGRFKDKTARTGGKKDYLHGFLAPLFFEILSVKRDDRGGKKTEVAREYMRVFGDLIYLNGGLFSQRDWEKSPVIAIPDAAFEKIFSFFGAWNWQLDERPTQAGNEINPDVLGYVFEKFINQKQMGAYYTKEDITGYISKNTILPRLFEMSGIDAARPMGLLRGNIERYVYPAVKHGCELALPPEIEAGIAEVPKRDGWNRPASADLGLPTETWREVVARRQRFESLAGPNATAEFASVSDLITHNLDISQWFVDLVADITEPGELGKLWTALEEISILDPTVGSGAFLFAAMGVLQPVYSACLERMDGFTSEADARAQKQSFKAAPSFDKFRDVLREIESHPNRLYAIYKKLTVQNLYGVDIMPEATEICKLRLFLKLAAQVSPDESKPNLGIEPLPDIDFNIRAGNTLVGFATSEEVKIASQTQINFNVTWEEIEAEMRSYGAALDAFRQTQLSGGTSGQSAKAALYGQHDTLVEKLNLFNAGQYAQSPKSQPKEYAKWKASHQPFHWCAEFYSVIKNGGFDVIIGNPPYVEYAKVRGDYTIKGYETESCGNLYAFVMERALKTLNEGGRMGVIVPTGSISSDRMIALQQQLVTRSSDVHLSHYSAHGCPSTLFEGAFLRLTIVLNRGGDQGNSAKVYSSKYMKWYGAERPALFSQLDFYRNDASVTKSSILKIESQIAHQICEKMLKNKPLENYLAKKLVGQSLYYYNAPLHWMKAFDFVPRSYNERDGEIFGSHYKEIKADEKYIYSVISGLNSHLFYFWFVLFSNVRDLSAREVTKFPFDVSQCTKEVRDQLNKLGKELMTDYKRKSTLKVRMQETTGRMELQEIDPKKSKPIIEKIDRVLAAHYGFTEEETDFIINYDIKYRMGRSADEE